MASKLLNLLAFICVVQICLAAVYRQLAPVTDPKLLAKGYSCQNEEVGLMKSGEDNSNYSPKTCARVSCYDGELVYATCGVFSVPPGTKIIPMDPTKPYPECCSHPKF